MNAVNVSFFVSEKEMGYAIKSFCPNNLDRRYPMLPATIRSINQAFQEIKTFSIDSWEGDYRPCAQKALKDILEQKMHNAIDQYLAQSQDVADRRNGYYSRHLLTELGDLELQVPRTRTFSPIAILRRFARRTFPLERSILLAFALGLSTRKVSQALLPILGEPISASTISRVAQQLDTAVEAYHQRPLSDQYEVLLLDGIVLKRKTGMGAQKRSILVALGIRGDGKKEILDFCQAPAESQAAWEGFLNQLYRRGLTGNTLKLIIIDGGKGLLAALPLIYGAVPLQRCWAHKTRNILNAVKRRDQKAVKKDLQRISHASNLRKAYQAAQRFMQSWQGLYPKVTQSLWKDLSDLLAFLKVKTALPLKALRTTNAIERRFREVRRRTRPMGTFSDRTSIDRILFAIITHENTKEGSYAPFLLTHKS